MFQIYKLIESNLDQSAVWILSGISDEGEQEQETERQTKTYQGECAILTNL